MSTSTSAFPEVEEFRRRLRQEVSGLPRHERDRLLEQIDAHLQEAIPAASTQADVREVLDDLGSPEAIAQAAGTSPAAVHRAPYHEFIALVVLTVGSILFPLIGWVVGVVLVWTSNRWTLAQKWLATLVWPGGLGLLLLVSAAAWGTAHSCTSTPIPASPGHLSSHLSAGCASVGASSWLLDLLAIVLITAPVLVALYLGLRIRDLEGA